MSQVFVSLDDIAGRLGREKAIQIIQYSLPFVTQKAQQLCDSLLVEDWAAASVHAHKALSSVRLFGSAKLETLLVQIRDGFAGQDAEEIQRELSAEFADVQSAAHIWLAQTNKVN